MKDNIPTYEMTVFDLIYGMADVDRKVRAELSDVQPLDREWGVATEMGRFYLEHKIMRHLETNLSKEEVLVLWDKFMVYGKHIFNEILNDLQTPPPDRIDVDFRDIPSDGSIAAVDINDEGKATLHLYIINCLARRFIHFLFAKHEFQKKSALLEFGSTLAHEGYHLYQYQHYLNSLNNERVKKPYEKRRYEKGARLYTIQWLKRQVPENIQDRLAIALVRIFKQLEEKEYDNNND